MDSVLDFVRPLPDALVGLILVFILVILGSLIAEASHFVAFFIRKYFLRGVK